MGEDAGALPVPKWWLINIHVGFNLVLESLHPRPEIEGIALIANLRLKAVR